MLVDQKTALLQELLTEQKRTNALLLALVEALADEAPEDVPRTHYMDGTPIDG